MRYLLCLLLTAGAISSKAQEREFIREGNRLYGEKKYDSASTLYLAAGAGKPDYAAAWFNLGNSETQQGKHEKAVEAYKNAIANTQDKQLKAAAYYGIGNTFAAQKKWKEATQAYRQSLRQSPADADTKYNYSYALTQLKNEEEQQRQQQQNNPPPKPKNEPPQKPDDPKKNKDSQKNGDPTPNNEQPNKGKLSKEQADNILNALQQDEQKLQRDQNKGQPVQAGGSGKDW